MTNLELLKNTYTSLPNAAIIHALEQVENGIISFVQLPFYLKSLNDYFCLNATLNYKANKGLVPQHQEQQFYEKKLKEWKQFMKTEVNSEINIFNKDFEMPIV